jgi:serine/threonine-protein kinase
VAWAPFGSPDAPTAASRARWRSSSSTWRYWARRRETVQREGSILARLTHPHIARLIDAGVAAGGQPYLVLEYVEGEPIDRWCDSNALSIEARVRLFLDVLAAIAHAHNKLILHRDLKPSNILVTKDGRVKLLDFGIAKLLDDEAIPVQASELTQQAGRAFTPEYAAPEQVQGQDVSTATDVYALGVLLYLLLTGQHPTSASAKTPVERLQAVVNTEPARLSHAVVRGATSPPSDLADIADRRAATPLKLVRALRGDLDNIVAKALKKAPAERYGTVDALADDLQRYLNHEPVSAHADTMGYRLTKFVQRYRVAVVTAASVAIMLVAVSMVALWQMFEADRQREVAQDEAARALSTRDFLEFLLTDVGSSGRPYTTTELLDRAERSIYAQYGSGESKRAIEQLIQIGALYSSVGQQKKSLELAETAYRRAASAGYQELRREAACNLGQQYHFVGKVQEGAVLLDQAIMELRGRETEAPTLVGCLQRKADLELTRGDAASGVALATEAVTLATRLSHGSPLAQVAPRTQLAIAYRVAGEIRLADDGYRELLELLKSAGRERTVDAIVVYNGWGKLKSDVGEIAEAARLIESAIEIGRAVRPDGKPDYIVSLNYAQRLLLLKRLDEAQKYFSQAQLIAETEADADIALLSMIGIAAVQRERGDFVAAKAALNSAAQFAREKLPKEDRAQMAILLETGRLYLANRSFAAALASLSEFTHKNSTTKVRTPDRALALSVLAQTELALGQGDKAIAHAAEASSMASGFALPGNRRIGSDIASWSRQSATGPWTRGARAGACRAVEAAALAHRWCRPSIDAESGTTRARLGRDYCWINLSIMTLRMARETQRPWRYRFKRSKLTLQIRARARAHNR